MSDGYADFVEAQLPRLLVYARALAGNEHDAWDLVQETMARMGLRWSRIDRHGNPGAYARTTLARLNVDRLRHRGRQRPVAVVPEISWTPVESVVEPWLVEALAGLPVRQRTALVLRYVDDLDHAGIAQVMGCAVGTARAHVSRGLAALRAMAEPPRVQPGVARSLVAVVERRRRRRRGWIAAGVAAVVVAGGVTAGMLVGGGSGDPEPAGPGPTETVTGEVVPTSGEWTRIGEDAPLEPRERPAMLTDEGRLWVLGGSTPSCPGGADPCPAYRTYGDGAVLDTETETWTKVASLPEDAAIVDAKLAGDQVVVMGFDRETTEYPTYLYDPAGDAWTRLPGRTPEAAMADAVWDGSMLHLAEGQTIWSLDLAEGRWTDQVVPKLPWSVAEYATIPGVLMAGDDGELLLSRWNDGTANDTLVRWRPGNGAWEEVVELPWRGSTGIGGYVTYWADGLVIRSSDEGGAPATGGMPWTRRPAGPTTCWCPGPRAAASSRRSARSASSSAPRPTYWSTRAAGGP